MKLSPHIPCFSEGMIMDSAAHRRKRLSSLYRTAYSNCSPGARPFRLVPGTAGDHAASH